MQVMGVQLDEEEITLTRDAGCPEHYRGDGFITCSRAMKAALGRWPAAMALPCTMAVWWWCCAFKYVDVYKRQPMHGGSTGIVRSRHLLVNVSKAADKEAAMREIKRLYVVGALQ